MAAFVSWACVFILGFRSSAFDVRFCKVVVRAVRVDGGGRVGCDCVSMGWCERMRGCQPRPKHQAAASGYDKVGSEDSSTFRTAGGTLLHISYS